MMQKRMLLLGERWKTLDESWRVAITVFLIARLFYGLWSWVILTIQPLAVQNLELSGQPVLTAFSLDTSRGYVYLREVNGQTLSFRVAGTNGVTDSQSGSIWDVSTGTALQGHFEGSKLSPANTRPSEVFPYHGATPYPVKWLGIWQRFDANWYISIAEHGYGGVPGGDHFPPFFPILIRLLNPLFGSSFLAGLFISHLATLVALKLMYDIFSTWGNPMSAQRTIFLILIYPTSFFLFTVYSESLYLVTALLALRYMQAKAWAWAGFWSFCAIITRLQGAALMIPLVYLMWKDSPILRKPAHWMGVILPSIGGLFYLYLRSQQVTSGVVPFVESEWHARLVPPWETYGYAVRTLFSGQFTFIDVLNWAVATVFIALTVWGWKKIPLEYNLYTVVSLLIILIRIVETQPLISMSRYSLMLFPVFFIFDLAGANPWVRRVMVYSFLALNLYLSAQFFTWGWVA